MNAKVDTSWEAVEARIQRNVQWRSRFGELSPIVVNDIDPLSNMLRALLAERDILRQQLAGLRAFAQDLFADLDWPNGGDLDGLAFQDLATKHGLLEEKQMEAPCGEHCQCAEVDEPPFACFRKTPLLLGDAALASSDSAQEGKGKRA